MTTTTKTPGYNVRLGIYFTADKNGKKRAYRWGAGQFRAFPIGVDKAEAFIAQGFADLLPCNPITGR
jgi:hypothetical protein